MELNLPAKCFISHAYDDAEAVDRLVDELPPGVPFIFPPITVKPDEIISNHLINAILECEGLIYLRGGRSEQSFWVAFERDYALRAGKKVYSFDPVTRQIEPDHGSPLDLAVYASYARKDIYKVRKIVKFLSTERYFDIWIDTEDLQPGVNYAEAITTGIDDQVERGGYLVSFWSEAAAKSAEVEKEIRQTIEDRVLFALLEDCPLPSKYRSQPRETLVQLYGDKKRSGKKRLDDLVVQLYWLIYRNTKKLE